MTDSNPNNTDIQASLGPFSIPPDYVLEPELRGPTTRPIPESVRASYGDIARRKYARRCFFVGCIIFGIGCLSILLHWPRHFAPLGYLIWGCLPFFALSAWHLFRQNFGLGPYRYVQEGLPLVARVIELFKAPTLYVNSEPTSYAFTALIECLDPRTGQLFSTTVKSREFTKPHAYTTSFKVGDYLTAIYLPNKFPESLKLYAFTDLNPLQGLVPSASADSARRRWLKGILTALAVILILVVLFWNIGAFSLYLPIDLAWTMLVPLGLGSLVLGGGILFGLALDHRNRRHRRDEENRRALASGEAILVGHVSPWDRPGLIGWVLRVMIVAGSLLIGGLTVLCWAFTVNAVFDDSPPRRQPVLVIKSAVPAQNARFRHYAIKYKIPGSSEEHDFHTVTEDLGEVRPGPAEAEVCAGKLGWPWVKAIRSPK